MEPPGSVTTCWRTVIKHLLSGITSNSSFLAVEHARRVVINNARCFRVLLFTSLIIISLLFSFTLYTTEQETTYIPPNSFQHVFVKNSPRFNGDASSLKQDDPTQIVRQKRVNDVCQWAQKTDLPTKIQPELLNHIYVNDRHKFLYCEVPKVACTNFKAIMVMLTGEVNATGPEQLKSHLVHGDYQKHYLRNLANYTMPEISHRINNYYKFMFVREPLERLLSAYRNKFTEKYSDYFQIRFGRKIVKRYRTNPTNRSLAKGHDVTFNEFVKYLTDPRITNFNAHWQHYYKLCLPCQLQYDFIGKYEHLKEDVDKVLYHLGLENAIHFPQTRHHSKTTGSVVKAFFRNITSQEVHDLWKLYSVDYRMFGYRYPSVH